MSNLTKAEQYLDFNEPMDFHASGNALDNKMLEWQALTNELIEEAISRQENNEEYDLDARYVYSDSQYCQEFIKIKMDEGLKSKTKRSSPIKNKIRVIADILFHNFFIVRAINEKRYIVDETEEFRLSHYGRPYKPDELRSNYIYFYSKETNTQSWIELETAMEQIILQTGLPALPKIISDVSKEIDGSGYNYNDGYIPTIHLYNLSPQLMRRADDENREKRSSSLITHFDDCLYDYYEDEFKDYLPADLFGIIPCNHYNIKHTLNHSEERERYDKLFDEYYINLADNDPERALLLKQTHLTTMLGYNPSDIGINLVGSENSGIQSYLDSAIELAGGRSYNLSYENICSDKYVEELCNSSLIYADYGFDDPVLTSRRRVKQSIQGEMMTYNRPYRPVEKFATPDSTIIQTFNHMPIFKIKNSDLDVLLEYMTAIKFKQDQFAIEYKDLIDEVTDKRAIPFLAYYLIRNVKEFKTYFFGPDYEEFLDANGHAFVKDEDINLHGVYAKSYINRLRRHKLKHKI